MYEGIPGSKQVQHYAAMITRTDQMVGKILDTLSELHLDEDTIIFYTSDNGPNAPFVKAIDSAGGLREQRDCCTKEAFAQPWLCGGQAMFLLGEKALSSGICVMFSQRFVNWAMPKP